MKICGNSNVNLIKLNQEKDSINFRAKIPVTVMNPKNWGTVSVAAAAAASSIGMAGLALNLSDKNEIEKLKKFLANQREVWISGIKKLRRASAAEAAIM